MDIISRAFWSDMEETMMFIEEGMMRKSRDAIGISLSTNVG